jgi:phosphoesterase RecJ-like protein
LTENNQRSSVEPNWFSYPPIDEEILSLIRSRDEFVVIGHVNPDGDCLSSQFATAELLSTLGKRAELVNAGPFERSEISHLRSDFLRHVDEELYRRDPLVIVVDCSSVDRIGYLADEIKGLTTVIFDHHSSGEQFGDYRYIVPRSVSTTLIIMQLFKALGVEITQEVAEHLFFGFATDSGFFRFLNAWRGETLRLVSELVDKGVSPNEMADRMSGGKSEGFVKYLGKLIDRSESLMDGRLMISCAYLKDQHTFTTNDKPSDALYGMLLSIKGVEMVLFFKELEDGKTEVGFRSAHSSPINVGEVAETFGGGGHRKASGATVALPIEEARSHVIAGVQSLFS